MDWWIDGSVDLGRGGGVWVLGSGYWLLDAGSGRERAQSTQKGQNHWGKIMWFLRSFRFFVFKFLSPPGNSVTNPVTVVTRAIFLEKSWTEWWHAAVRRWRGGWGCHRAKSGRPPEGDVRFARDEFISTHEERLLVVEGRIFYVDGTFYIERRRNVQHAEQEATETTEECVLRGGDRGARRG